MTTHKLNGYEIALPEIPEGATVYRVHQLKTAWLLTDITQIPLPEGDWQLFRLSEVPESLAGEMVEKERDPWGFNGWMNYDKEHSSALDFNFDTAHASLTSWVRTQGVTENDPYLLIKKTK